MRLRICALFLCAATTAFCQSATPVPANPDKTNQPSLNFNLAASDSTRTPPAWLSSSVSAQPTIVQRNSPLVLPAVRTPIDPKMIVRPPKSSLGVQPQGTLVAQNLYPGLRFQPIETSTAKLYPIPTPWPHLKLQKIPIVWPNYKLIPIDSKTPMPASAPAK